MKVLFTFGGIPHYLKAMLNRIQEKGVDVTTVIPLQKSSTIGAGVKMVEGGGFKSLPTEEKKSLMGKNYFPALPQIIKQEKPDILVLGWPYFLQIALQPSLRKAMKQCGTRLVIREIPFQTPPFGNIRSYFRENPMYDENMQLKSCGMAFHLRQWIISLLRRYCYSKAKGTLNYSTAAYEVLPSYGIRREQIHVTYNSTDTSALQKERKMVEQLPPMLPPCPHRLLHIGRLVKWKRVDLLIEAFHTIKEKYEDAELLIIGNGPELESLKRQAAATAESSSIQFIGAVYEPQLLGRYMYESSIYVLAGMGGLSINDAMTYGMPVVCSVCDSTERDLVKEGINGAFFKEGDAKSLADKICDIFSSPERIKNMGRESERIIREEINIETVSNRYIEAFKAVMQS